ncbi:LOW QUALITY PROTEIN: gasdermin-D-like [Arvicanthis niloticus]|uniref:LOW QUALITY PROTEIN: gasdermin-D-like n=1 Tax=Arvicanthis niloticus TaxID=61156 RepID=UPI00148702BE|nr:LOW QUALITY PROTEIN: gasdermin-D-like [Arvicanthis niloticus]
MPSAFERAVKSVMKEVDSKGDLIPVDCLWNSISFRPYCLLSRRFSSSWFWKPPYKYVNLSIKDILEPSAPEPEPECFAQFQVSDVTDGNIQGSVALSDMAEGRISCGAAVSGSSSASMSVCILSVNPNIWAIMQRERHLQQPENKILQQLQSRGDDLFVIIEVLQTEKEVQITMNHSQEGSGQFTLSVASCFQGEGKGHKSRKKMVTVPAGSILAFQVAQLLIGSTWDILLVSDEKQRTFEPSSDVTHVEEVIREDFQGLYAEVKAGASELGRLKMELRQQLLVDIGRILQDQTSLEALEASLGQGLCSGGQVERLDGPAGCILQCLQLDSGQVDRRPADTIFYLLGALNVLSETQRQLLANAMEMTVLSKQLELVELILEQSTPWEEQCSVSLPSRLLGDSWHEEAPTWVLLEECGLRLQVEPPQVHWEPTSQGPTCALYASLAILSSLGQEPH